VISLWLFVFTRTRFKSFSHTNTHNQVLWLLVLEFYRIIYSPLSRCSQGWLGPRRARRPRRTCHRRRAPWCPPSRRRSSRIVPGGCAPVLLVGGRAVVRPTGSSRACSSPPSDELSCMRPRWLRARPPRRWSRGRPSSRQPHVLFSSIRWEVVPASPVAARLSSLSVVTRSSSSPVICHAVWQHRVDEHG
jgi:hypothetical protein